MTIQTHMVVHTVYMRKTGIKYKSIQTIKKICNKKRSFIYVHTFDLQSVAD